MGGCASYQYSVGCANPSRLGCQRAESLRIFKCKGCHGRRLPKQWTRRISESNELARMYWELQRSQIPRLRMKVRLAVYRADYAWSSKEFGGIEWPAPIKVIWHLRRK